MRWACAKMISYLGSCPQVKYKVHGLPEHLSVYSRGVARMNPSPPGQRSIDSRLAPKPVTSRKSDRKAGGASSTPKKTRATDTSVKAKEDTTPATPTVEEGEVAVVTVEAEATSDNSEPMDVHDAEAKPDETTEPLLPVKPLFKNTDVREKRETRRKYLEKMLLVFKQENHGSGTRALTQYLQAMTIPRKCINELIPEEVEYLSESEMQKTILRVQTLSNSAL